MVADEIFDVPTERIDEVNTMRKPFVVVIGAALLCWYAPALQSEEWQPKNPRLLTRWASEVNPQQVHGEYPRPQLVRDSWENLNGLWQYAIRPQGSPLPREFDGEILVPFCAESSLSGVGRSVGAENELWYRRTFKLPESFRGHRVLLHFGAVDWRTTVWVDRQEVGKHAGGYDPFSFDITSALARQEIEIVVRVWDPTDEGSQARGKQNQRPHGIWYTSVTGIWQTVWLEAVPQQGFIKSLTILPNVETGEVVAEVATEPADQQWNVKIAIDGLSLNGKRVDFETISGAPSPANSIRHEITTAHLWSPDEPWLYHVTAEISDGAGDRIDSVTSYFGMRKVGLGRDANGVQRILLNGKPLFQFGPLDQGWWPDGLYTAPSDAALRYDLEVTKNLGFNMVRKHVKVEPARWYSWCDQIGLLVWQDMPNGGEHAPWPRDGTEIQRDQESAQQFEEELRALVDSHRNHPSIVMWVPFNEGWGQFDTVRIAEWLTAYDATRLVNAASGGNDFLAGDVDDDHFYPGPGAAPALPQRAVVLGEYGGLGLPLKGHTWQDEENWGYRSFSSQRDLTNAYLDLIKNLRRLVESHLSAAVYTQTTDVEIEVNGLMTYDRERLKLDEQQVVAAHRELFEPLPALHASTSQNLTTLAWWRFEEGEPSQRVPNTQEHPRQMAARDVSGHNNHLYAYGRPQSPSYSDQVAEPSILQTGETNAGCLDDTRIPEDGIPSIDLFTDAGRSRTHMDVINNFQFRHWTIEVSFRVLELDRFHGLVGKDGKPLEGPFAPLQLKVRGDDNRLQVEVLDSGGSLREVRSKNPVLAQKWYHAAAISDGQVLRLYLNSGNGYQLQGTSHIEGQLFNSDGTWTVGRGFYDGQLADDARALLDEIRISVSARKPDQLLMTPGPSNDEVLP